MDEQWEVQGLVGGPHGGLVRVGAYLVPPRALVTYQGTDPGYQVALEVRGGRPEVVGISFVAKRDQRGLRPADLHDLEQDLERLVRDAYARLAVRPEVSPDEPDALLLWGSFDATEPDREMTVRKARRGKPTPAELEQVARLYREQVDTNPVKFIEHELGYTSYRTALRRVEQARRAGLLPPTTPGKRRA